MNVNAKSMRLSVYNSFNSFETNSILHILVNSFMPDSERISLDFSQSRKNISVRHYLRIIDINATIIKEYTIENITMNG